MAAYDDDNSSSPHHKTSSARYTRVPVEWDLWAAVAAVTDAYPNLSPERVHERLKRDGWSASVDAVATAMGKAGDRRR